MKTLSKRHSNLRFESFSSEEFGNFSGERPPMMSAVIGIRVIRGLNPISFSPFCGHFQLSGGFSDAKFGAGGGKCSGGMRISMRDRSKNRKPLQRGRNLSIEAIQTVQALKRVKKDDELFQQAMDSRFRRLLKFDMVAVLKEFLRQNECDLALKVFEDIREEFWYKPHVLLFADMIAVLANNDLFDQVRYVYKCLKVDSERIEAGIEEFNFLLRALVGSKVNELAVDCFYFMKELGCEPDRSSFRILINGLEIDGEETDASVDLRRKAKQYYGESLEFLNDEEVLPVRRRY